MKTTRKISIALVIVMLLMMTLAIIPASAASTITVYFRNNWDFTDVTCYYWGATNAPTWPGYAMEKVDTDDGKDIYAIELPSVPTGIVFVGKDKGVQKQTPDIINGIVDGQCWQWDWSESEGDHIDTYVYTPSTTEPEEPVVPEVPSEEEITVYFQNNWLWTNVSYYYWIGEGNAKFDNVWPGEAMTFVENDGIYDIYSASIPANVTGIIISGTKNDGSGSTDQTPDIKTGLVDGAGWCMSWDNGNVASPFTYVPSYDITFAEEEKAVPDPDVWHFWNDQGWCGSNVTVSNAHYDGNADKATFTYSDVTTNCWFGMQVFYKNSALEAGKTYKLTCTVTSEVAGDVTINGTVITLAAGENAVEVTFTEVEDKASFSLQCGVNGGTVIPENTFSISDLTYTLVEGNEGDGGEDNPVTPPATSGNIVYGTEGTAVDKPGNWYFWNESNVTVSNANYDAESGKATFTYSGVTPACWYGMQLFYEHPSNVTGNTYKLTCTITSEVAGDITINRQVITLVEGENNIELTVVESAGASFSLQCGNETAGTVIPANTISISNLKFTQDYYLIGWINDADYSGEDYKFVDGKLVVKFTAANNWVAIKAPTGGWYYFSEACYASSGTLAQGNPEKMNVPGNVEVTFTLVENADGTLTLSYTKPAAAVDPNANYTVAGVTSLTGAEWDASSQDNKMTYDATNNVFVKVYTGIAAGKHQIKVVKDNNWDTCYGGTGSGGNFDVDVALGNSTVTVIFNPANDSISYTEIHVHDMAAATCTLPSTCKYCTHTEGEAKGHNYSEGICSGCGAADPTYCGHTETKVVNTATCTEAGVTYTACAKCGEPLSEEKEVAALGHSYDKYGYCGVCKTGIVHTVAGVKDLCGTDWNPEDENNNLLFNPETGEYSITYKDVKAGTYQFKVVMNHDWTGAYGGTAANGNYEITTYETLDITISIVNNTLVVKMYETLESAKVYNLIPGDWSNDNAWFAIYCFDKNPGGKNEWVTMTKVDGSNYYTATVPAGYSHIIFVRQDPASTEYGWTWGQSADIAITEEGDAYIMTPVEGDYGKGEWHTHSYKATVTAPTCTENGYTTHTCSCGDSYTDTYVDALTHDWADATCTAPKTCKRTGCGATEGEKLGHDLTVYPAVDPTCTEKGLTAGEKCNRTGCTHNVPQTEVAAKGHEFGEWYVTTEATEDNNGEQRRDCKNCDHYETDVIPKLNHDCSRHETTPIPAVPATCTTPGSTAGTKCSDCGATVKAPEPIPALNHNLVDDAAVAPTCTEAGLTAGKHCTRCDYKVAQEAVAALGHDMTTDAAVAPTCTETGLTEGSHCSRCDHKVAQETVAALGHTEVVDAAVAATCTTAGKTEGKHCSVCDTVLVAQETVAALGHTEVVDAAVAATCTTEGKTEGKHCSVCNEVLVAQQEIKAKGHSFAEGKCSVCGAADPNYVPPHEHNFVEGKCECGEIDPDYEPEEELGFFEAIWKAIVDFFKSIGDFFVNLFSGGKK